MARKKQYNGVNFSSLLVNSQLKPGIRLEGRQTNNSFILYTAEFAIGKTHEFVHTIFQEKPKNIVTTKYLSEVNKYVISSKDNEKATLRQSGQTRLLTKINPITYNNAETYI